MNPNTRTCNPLNTINLNPGAGSARYRPLAAHGVWCPAEGLNLKTGQLFRHYIAEISPNVTLKLQLTKTRIYASFANSIQTNNL